MVTGSRDKRQSRARLTSSHRDPNSRGEESMTRNGRSRGGAVAVSRRCRPHEEHRNMIGPSRCSGAVAAPSPVAGVISTGAQTTETRRSFRTRLTRHGGVADGIYKVAARALVSYGGTSGRAKTLVCDRNVSATSKTEGEAGGSRIHGARRNGHPHQQWRWRQTLIVWGDVARRSIGLWKAEGRCISNRHRQETSVNVLPSCGGRSPADASPAVAPARLERTESGSWTLAQQNANSDGRHRRRCPGRGLT